MKITEFDKQILSGIENSEIYNEFGFILKFINHTVGKKSDGYDYYVIENSEEALRKYINYIQLVGFLVEQKMIKTIDINTSYENAIIKHRTESNYSNLFDSYRSVYRNQSIIKFISLDSFIENNYKTDSQIEFEFSKEVQRELNERYLSEKKTRTIYQRISITVSVITVIVSFFAILASIGVFSEADKSKTYINHNFYLKFDSRIEGDSLHKIVSQKPIFEIYLDSLSSTKTEK